MSAGSQIDTLIVGGSVAGVALAEELRRFGDTGSVVVVESQPHLPYDRPPLSKGVLTGATDEDELAFHDAAYYASHQITVRPGIKANALDAAARIVELDTGERVAARRVVLATGAHARPLVIPGVPRVHLIRERDDAIALRDALRAAHRLVVVGGGFIGAEVASSATTLGIATTIVELGSRPFESSLGPVVAELMLDLHRGAGVDVRCDVAVARGERAGDVLELELTDGRRLAAEVVVAGLGAIPTIDWLATSGIAIDDGIVCDESGRTSMPGVFAVGDAARWRGGGPRQGRRHEHWTSAREQARVVAQAITGHTGPRWADAVPYVWSDQHGKRVQLIGVLADADVVEVVKRDDESGAFLALYGREGRLVAAVGCNQARAITRQRPLIAARAAFADATGAFARRV
jgi:3-phenylpropionate/trans-cinnamate dioxygenase ferredoxin reductase component